MGVWRVGFADFLSSRVNVGALTLVVTGKPARTFGDGSGPPVRCRVSPQVAFAIGLNPWLKAGEAYTNGDLVLEEGTIFDLADLIGRNFAPDKGEGHSRGWRRTAFALNRAVQGLNGRLASRRNVAHHYDISVDFYRLFLDADLQYSCAYIYDPAQSLEQWQEAKKAHLAAKLRLRPGDHVLDIGCGWGGLALSLAEDWGADVVGITLSTEQLQTAQTEAARRGLKAQARFELRDYRDVEGRFDRIVSVGMFEHVGRRNYQAYFDAIARLLADDGVALIHSIGRSNGPGITNPWVAKYIFPGGYAPSLSEVLPSIERSGLVVTDIEVLRLHYAETLKAWGERFTAVRSQVAEIYDERFCRMWEFYLAFSAVSFRHDDHMNFQIQLTRRPDTLPITRDYMTSTETEWNKLREGHAPAEDQA